MFKLTVLEKAALLKKAGLAHNLLEAKRIHIQEMDGPYNPKRSPEGEWDHCSWHGGPKSGGKVGYSGYNRIYRVSLSSREFVILEISRGYQNESDYPTNHEKEFPDGNCSCCGEFYYLFASEGEEIDKKRIACMELKELLENASKHLPEAIDMLREEIPKIP
jgi:hypothetical protein